MAPGAVQRSGGAATATPLDLVGRRGVLLAAVLLSSLAGCSTPAAGPDPAPITSGVPPTASAGPSQTPTRTPSGQARSEQTGNPSSARDLLTGLTTPWGLLPLRDGTLLAGERDTGRIVKVADGRGEPVRTLEVAAGGEGGLLGLEATPDERTVFAYFTSARDNRIVAMSWDGSRLGDPRTVLTGIPKGYRHNGGALSIGPDGLLYVGTGETGDTRLAQDRASLGGKVLRITLDGKPAAGNPFGNEVWSLGHRNIEGLAFDGDGRLWASEFGDSRWDELNVISEGNNYGWPEVEGTGGGSRFTDPKRVWRTSDASPSGLAYWRGSLWMAALRGQRLWRIPIEGAEAGDPTSLYSGMFGRLRNVAATTDGEALILATSNTDGRGDPRNGDDRIMELR